MMRNFYKKSPVFMDVNGRQRDVRGCQSKLREF